MDKVQYQPIGIIFSSFEKNIGIPRQAAGAPEVKGTIKIFDEFSEGLRDLDGFSHIMVVFHLHLVKSPSLRACPPWDDKEHGVFATRSPYRPNPVGVSVVCLEKIERNILHVSGIDMANETPVLDIKPYVPGLKPRENIKLGWLTGKVEGMNKSKSGDR